MQEGGFSRKQGRARLWAVYQERSVRRRHKRNGSGEIKFEPDSSKTKVSVDTDLKLGKLGAVLGVFAKGKIKDGLEHMIEEFERVVNSN